MNAKITAIHIEDSYEASMAKMLTTEQWMDAFTSLYREVHGQDAKLAEIVTRAYQRASN